MLISFNWHVPNVGISSKKPSCHEQVAWFEVESSLVSMLNQPSFFLEYFSAKLSNCL